MDIILREVSEQHAPLILLLAKTLGIQVEEREVLSDAENRRRIDEAIRRIEDGAAEPVTVDMEKFRKLAYGE